MSPILFLRCRHRLLYLSISLGKSSPGNFFYLFLKVGGVLDCRAGGRWFSTQGLKIHWHSNEVQFFFSRKVFIQKLWIVFNFFPSHHPYDQLLPAAVDKPLVYRSRGHFLESPGNVSDLESCLCLPGLHSSKIKVSIILKIIQWNYQLTKQSWLVCEQGTVLLLNKYWY